MRLGLARKKNYSSYIKDKTVGLKKWSKKKVNLKMKETSRCLKQLTGHKVFGPYYQVVCYVAKILSRYVEEDETASHDVKKNSCN